MAGLVFYVNEVLYTKSRWNMWFQSVNDPRLLSVYGYRLHVVLSF